MSIDANPDIVADVRGPQALPVAFINTIVTRIGSLYEVWIKFGKKFYPIAKGEAEAMNAKAERVRRFASDPFAPLPSSVADFVVMAKGI